MAKHTHLISRVFALLGVDHIDFEEYSLNSLITLFKERVTAPPTTDAEREGMSLVQLGVDNLLRGESIAFFDVNANVVYFVIAVKEELIAVHYSMGMGYNLYTIMGSNKQVLIDMDIKDPGTNDPKVIDRIFGWTDEEVEQAKTDKAAAATAATPTEPKWNWQFAKSPDPKDGEQAKEGESLGKSERVVAEEAAARETVTVEVPAATEVKPPIQDIVANRVTQSVNSGNMGEAFRQTFARTQQEPGKKGNQQQANKPSAKAANGSKQSGKKQPAAAGGGNAPPKGGW